MEYSVSAFFMPKNQKEEKFMFKRKFLLKKELDNAASDMIQFGKKRMEGK